MMARAASSGAQRPGIVGAAVPIARPTEEARQGRKRRAAALQQQVGGDQATTTLQKLAVTKATHEYYTKLVNELETWLQRRKVRPKTEHEWDDQVAAKMDEWYLEGYAAHRGEKLLAAVLRK